MGIGDWGLGIGPNPQSPIPNPQSPIPNPQSPKSILNNIIVYIYYTLKLNKILLIFVVYLIFKSVKA
jgi:hypothetical protein